MNSKYELVIVTCREGHAKTSLMIESINTQLKKGSKIVFLSYECKKEYIIDRFSNIDNLVIYDTPISSIEEIRKYIEDNKPDYLYIDYLQIIPNYDKVIFELKKLTREYELKIIVNSILKPEYYNLSSNTLMSIEDDIYKVADRCLVFGDEYKH